MLRCECILCLQISVTCQTDVGLFLFKAWRTSSFLKHVELKVLPHNVLWLFADCFFFFLIHWCVFTDKLLVDASTSGVIYNMDQQQSIPSVCLGGTNNSFWTSCSCCAHILLSKQAPPQDVDNGRIYGSNFVHDRT